MIARLLTGLDVSPPGADCARCLRSSGVYVPGCGPERAELVLVGEAPGKQEARMGKPFVGPSGKLLDRVLADAGIERGACYITNACLCVGPANPKAKEVAACRERLLAEVVSRSPKLVVVMGNPALRAVLGRTNISRERGAFVWSEELSAFVLPTYHPAAVLRSPGLYADLLNDFRLVAKALAGGGEATGKRMKVKQELSVEHTVVSNVEDLLTEIERASSGGDLLAVDVETASDGSLLCLSMAWENGRAVVVPGELARRCAGALDRLFASKCLVGHNFQFDLRVLWRNGMPSARTGKDTLLLAYSLDERKGKHSLGDVVREQLNVPDHKRPMEKYKNCMEKAPVVQLYRYNALDAAYTYFLVGVLEPLVDQDGHRVLNTLLYPASDVLARMTAVGTMVDLPYIHELDKQISIELAEKLEELHKLAGRQFNPNSPKQLVNLLYKELNLPIPVHLGKMSSDEEHLEFLAEYHPLPKRILEYRKRAKFLNTYVRGMAKAADAEARVHTTFNLGGTVTGRLSSSKPNLQNIGRDKENRNMFIATPGWALVEADMSQSELRVLAWFSQDKKFLEAFNSGVDIHTANAALMFDVPVEAVTKELRQSVKPLNFGVIYGMTSQSLAKELNVSVERADELMQKFFSTFRRAHEWIEETKQEVLRTGYLKTPFGRVRRFPFISKENMAEQLRQAVNFLIQSVSSDITLSAVIRLGKKLWDDPTTRLLLTVHDSILLETLDNPVEVAHTVSREMMQNVLDGSVPFVAEAKVGEKWGSLEQVP